MLSIFLHLIKRSIDEGVLPLGGGRMRKDLAVGSFLGGGLAYDALIVLSHCQLLLIGE